MADTRLLEPRRRIFAERVIRAEVARFTRHPGYQAFRLLQAAFVLLPVVAGLDKFFHLLVDWPLYLASPIASILPLSPHAFMIGVGLVEIAAGVWVALRPQVGAFVVAGWLGLIVVNLLLPPGFYDIALRDLGLALAAVTLGLLAREFQPAAPD